MKTSRLGIATGFNDEIPAGGQVFHVQTEDRRARNPRIQTLVYLSGNIVGTWKTPYREILDMPELDDIILMLMQRQHELVKSEVAAGRFHQQYFNKLLQEFLTTKSLEEVILEYKASLQNA